MAQALVGLDIGHRTVRAVSLRRVRGALTVHSWAAVPRWDDDGHERSLEAVLTDLKRRIDLGGAPVVAISTVASLVRYVSTVALPPDRLAKSLRLELLQNLEGATELAADTFTLPLPGDELRHCCILTQPAQVREALGAFTVAKVPLGSLHYAPAALLNTSLPSPPVEGKDLCLVVDVGAETTSVGLLGEGRLLACRQLTSGGQHFTDTLANARGVTPVLAETWKVSGQLPASSAALSSTLPTPGAAIVPSPVAPAPVKPPLDADDLFGDGPTVTATPSPPPAPAQAVFDGNALFDDAVPASAHAAPAPDASPAVAALFDDAPGPTPTSDAPVPFDPFKQDGLDAEAALIPPPAPGRSTMMMARAELGPEMTKAAEMLFAQLSSSIAWFKTQLDMPELVIATVRIAGGGAGLDGLDRYLERRFGVPVQRLDPFLGLRGQAPDRPHEFATAVGLALAAPGGHPEALRLELLPEGLLKTRLWTTTLVWPFVAAAAVLLAGIVTAWTWWTEQDAHLGEKRRVDTYTREHAKRLALITGLRQERENLGDDVRAIASRIYAARDLLFTVRALKEQTERSRQLWVTHLETKDVGMDTAATAVPGAVKPTKPRNRADDTAINRGGVLIAGFVKFDAQKSDPEMNDFFDLWWKAIVEWQPEPGLPRLFGNRRVTNFDVKHLKEGKDKVKDGRVPFTVTFDFQPTQLNQVTTNDGGPVEPATPSSASPSAPVVAP